MYGHAQLQHVEPFLASLLADDLADSSTSTVHRADSETIVVHTHIERLDVQDSRTELRAFELLLGEIPFVLRLEIDSHFTGCSNFSPHCSKISHRLRIWQTNEVAADNLLQRRDGGVVDLLIKTACLTAVLQSIVEDAFEKSLGKVHVVEQSLKATSGSTIQNSAKCRDVLYFAEGWSKCIIPIASEDFPSS